MIFNISGKPVPRIFPYSKFFNEAVGGIPPLLVAAIAWRESLSFLSAKDAAACISEDDGHGVMQLTSSYPDDWADPEANIIYAIDYFLKPAWDYWHGCELVTGDDLVKLVAATYNEGLSAAKKYHAEGNVDAGTTNDYGEGVLTIYHKLRDKGVPE